MTHPTNKGQPKPPQRSVTVLETDEDVRQALLSGSGGPQQDTPIEPKIDHPPPPNTGRPADLYRPTARPPVPILTVFDDGKTDGEIIRIRRPKFTIGRTEGDLRFPLDGRMSARHVEITHQVVGGLHRWVVTDLQSTHGLFVRVSRTALADKAELLVGNGRYRYDDAQADREATADFAPRGSTSGRTQGLDESSGSFRPPALTELLGREIGNRLLLTKDEYWIGTDPSCQVCRPDDPFCEAKHLRLYRVPRGTWYAEHNKTRNGLWLRMAQITAEAMIYFQIGEQRFKLRVS